MWRISSPEVLAAFQQDADAFFKPAKIPVQTQPDPSTAVSSP
jgi:hypothetical protein